MPPALEMLRDAIRNTGAVPDLDTGTVQAILRHDPAGLDEVRLARIAEWSQPGWAIDKRFTRLTLLLDQGPEAQGPRWQAQRSFDDLRDVLAESDDPALVLLGPPGCGKSTLLQRLELDLAVDALRGDASPSDTITLFLPLARHGSKAKDTPPPLPMDWLESEWAGRCPGLLPLPELLAGGRVLLLLDAVNELPHRDEADYGERIRQWRDALAELARRYPGTRAVLSCRSLDYSASLSTPGLPVPHVRIERLADAQVEEFLSLYEPEHGPALWQRLRGTPQLDLFRSPFYLRLLLAQAGADGEVPGGHAALFTGFLRRTLLREVTAEHPLFRRGHLLDRLGYDRIVRQEWRDPHDLPARGPLLPALARLAFGLQARRAPGETSRVRAAYDDACELIGGDDADDILRAGVALQALELQWEEVRYVHQLMQEYFAARALAAEPRPELARSSWRAAEISPGLAEVLDGLADSDPLPAAPATGWEETFLLATPMARSADAFIASLAEENLPLAGRAAAQPDVAVSPALAARLRRDLVSRGRDPDADLRARIAAARALGELGDPRYERRRGPDGDYLLPPVVAVPGGRYSIGSDAGVQDDEVPAHTVALDGFALARFPVTNAEWRCFIDAGGYDDERWWRSEADRRWRRGDGTAEGPRQRLREIRQLLQKDPEMIARLQREGRLTSTQAEQWEELTTMADEAFETRIAGWYPEGRQTRPMYWNDPAYNHPTQPVVGVCWHEARAYCAWLSAQSGGDWRLPSEAEWEAAARGREQRPYPWGEGFDAARCNSFETHVRGTTPVGVFPGGDNPDGIADLAGNVWEWTGSLYRPYPYLGDDGREDAEKSGSRVVRGGSWDFSYDYVRAAYRYDVHPHNRLVNLGFRVLLSSPIR